MVIYPWNNPHLSLTLAKNTKTEFRLGNEVLLSEKSDLIKNKNIGLITNNSGIVSDGNFFVDKLIENKDVHLLKIFSPEHGFRGDDEVNNYIDDRTGIKVISLYGSKYEPSEKDLSDIDILVYDIQDVAARYYTYINTMFYCMQASYKFKKQIIICDRPVIPNPDYVDGFVLDENISSFVGMLKIPAAYGMTSGELAKYINYEYFDDKCDLMISEMKNYRRETDYSELMLTWSKPSPNIYFPSTAVAYQGTCLLEATNLSEGRGSDKPFEYIGAPYCNSDLLKKELDSFSFEGVVFEPVSFIPKRTDPLSVPKYELEECKGVYIKILDKKIAQPFKIAIAILISCKKLFPDFRWKSNLIYKLAGTELLDKMIDNGKTLIEITESYKSDLEKFKTIRNKFLLYN